MTTDDAGVARLRLEGEYDMFRQPEVQSLFNSVNDGPVVLDFEKVTYVDSLFLQEIIRLRRRLPEDALTLANVNSNIRRLLQVMGLDQLCRIV